MGTFAFHGMKKVQRKKGFTLIELIVVIAILAILAVVLLPVINGWTRRAGENNAINNAASVKNVAAIVYTEAESDIATDADGNRVVIDTSSSIKIKKAENSDPLSNPTDAASVFMRLAPNLPANDSFDITISPDGEITGTYTSNAMYEVNLETGEVTRV